MTTLKKRRKKLPRLPKPAFPEAAERRYTKALTGYITRYHRALIKELMADYKAVTKADAPSKPADMDQIVQQHFQGVNRINYENWALQLKAVGVNPLAGDRPLTLLMEDHRARNARLITRMTDQHRKMVAGVMEKAVAEGTRPETLAKALEARLNVSKSRAKLIARDQTNKLHGQMTQERHQNAGVTKYIWRTMQDDLVRGGGKYPDAEFDHTAREGQVFEWNNPPPDGHPGEPINDRCYAEPVLDDLVYQEEEAKATPGGSVETPVTDPNGLPADWSKVPKEQWEGLATRVEAYTNPYHLESVLSQSAEVQQRVYAELKVLHPRLKAAADGGGLPPAVYTMERQARLALEWLEEFGKFDKTQLPSLGKLSLIEADVKALKKRNEGQVSGKVYHTQRNVQ